jgi:3-dehydroquinate synthase
MQLIDVSLGSRSYPIYIGKGRPGEWSTAFRDLSPAPSKAVIVYDHRVEHLAAILADELGPAVSKDGMIDIPSGEESKSILHLEHLWKRLFRSGADRRAIVVAVGGGVIGDLVGFAAATWNRGIRFIQVPTTLLAMVDSSVGGKTGINLPEAKNVIGAFWQPTMVWADIHCLATLPTREFRSGLAEVVKYGVILDPDFFQYLESEVEAILSRDENVLIEIIRRSCLLKGAIVAEDERETGGRRAMLNYGHTFGHAIEALTDYGSLLHGEAVAIGMTMAGQLAMTMERWPKQSLERQTRLLERLGLPTRLWGEPALRCDVPRMLEAMQHDKKNEYGQLRLVLPCRLGNVETVAGVCPELVGESIAACRDVVENDGRRLGVSR